MPGNIVDFIAGLAQGGTNPDTGQPVTMGERMLAGVKSYDEGYANYAADANKAKALRQVVQAYAQDEPDEDKRQSVINFSHTAGLGDLEGYVQGHATMAAARKSAADIAEQTARANYYNDYGKYRDQQAQDEQSAGQWVKNYFTTPDQSGADDNGQSTPPTNEDRIRYASENTPGMSGRAFMQIPKFLNDYVQAQGGEGAVPKATNLNGTDVIYNPKTGAFTTPNKMADDLMETKPQGDDIPDGYMARQVGKGWQIVQDPTRWQNVIETDPENPMRQIHTQQLIPKAPGGAGKGGTNPPPGAPKAPANTVVMTDPQGNRVYVPKARQAEFIKKNYKL